MKIKLYLICAGLLALAIGSPAMAQEAAAASADSGWWPMARDYVLTPAAISGVASAAAAILPHGGRGTMWGFVRKVIDVAAWNWGNAENEPK